MVFLFSKQPLKYPPRASRTVISSKNLTLSVLCILTLLSMPFPEVIPNPAYASETCLNFLIINNSTIDGKFKMSGTSSTHNILSNGLQFSFFVYDGEIGDVIQGSLSANDGTTMYFSFELTQPGEFNQSLILYTTHVFDFGSTGDRWNIEITDIPDGVGVGSVIGSMFIGGSQVCNNDTSAIFRESGNRPFQSIMHDIPEDHSIPLYPTNQTINVIENVTNSSMTNEIEIETSTLTSNVTQPQQDIIIDRPRNNISIHGLEILKAVQDFLDGNNPNANSRHGVGFSGQESQRDRYNKSQDAKLKTVEIYQAVWIAEHIDILKRNTAIYDNVPYLAEYGQPRLDPTDKTKIIWVDVPVYNITPMLVDHSAIHNLITQD